MTAAPWSPKGVALYPPPFSMVGQNVVFNALHKFRREFGDAAGTDISGFCVLVGDWGVGKTRLGFELIAEATGQIDEWLLSLHDYVIPPYNDRSRQARVLDPAMKDGVLPLYIRYSTVCDNSLVASNWIVRVTLSALGNLTDGIPGAGSKDPLVADLQRVLHARGVELPALAVIRREGLDADQRLEAAMDVLRKGGIHHLWVIVDEVETPGDLRKGLRDETAGGIDECFLLMIPEVVKHEALRSRHPYANFLLLCSAGMQDQVSIGPNLRRSMTIRLQPNQVTDVRRYVQHLKESLPEPALVDYPPGTLEGAFMMSNRNFGWLNVVMASLQDTFAQRQDAAEPRDGWQLLAEFAQADPRAKYLLDTEAVIPLVGKVPDVPPTVVERLIYGQLPIPVADTQPAAIAASTAGALLRHEVPGRGRVFSELAQVHVDARTLADELTRPEVGFKAREGKTDTYYTSACEFSVVGLLAALHVFSASAVETSSEDFLAYIDLEQWVNQISALYPVEQIDLAAEPLHRIFMKPEYRVPDARFVGMSFWLWRDLDKLFPRSTESAAWFRDGQHQAVLEAYVARFGQSNRRRAEAVTLGLAKLLDERAEPTTADAMLRDLPHTVLVSAFTSPPIEGLKVTPGGRVTIVYAIDPDTAVLRLKDLLGAAAVHPILVLLSPGAEPAALDHLLDSLPALKRCVIVRRLINQEEDFLLKYSGRGAEGGYPREWPLGRTTNGHLKTYQDDWADQARRWKDDLNKSGFLLAPLWSKSIHIPSFARGYRFMLGTNCSMDALDENAGGPLGTVEFESFKQAAKKNVETPAGWTYGELLLVLKPDYSGAVVPPCFVAILQQLKTPSSPAKLSKQFFFQVPAVGMRQPAQVDQLLEMLIGIGLVIRNGDLYQAVDQTLLETRRESASRWLKDECKGEIKELQGLFPAQSMALLNGDYPEAGLLLTQAEQKIGALDFSVADAGDASVELAGLRPLVKGIADAEQLLIRVCPIDIGEAEPEFRCSSEQIAHYEARYAGLSLWEKTSFLDWLRRELLATRQEIIEEIDGILGEAAALSVVEGMPFPVAPLTLPLKAVRLELEDAVKGPGQGSQTRRPVIQAGSYGLLIDQYLAQPRYEDAWKRMRALRQLVDRAEPGSFFARFAALRDRWGTAVAAFARAMLDSQALFQFVSDAPPEVTARFAGLRREFTKYDGLVRGGLEQSIMAQTGEDRVAELLGCVFRRIRAVNPIESEH